MTLKKITEFKCILRAHLNSDNLSELYYDATEQQFSAKCEFTFFPGQEIPSVAITTDKFPFFLKDKEIDIRVYFLFDYIEQDLMELQVTIMEWPHAIDGELIKRKFIDTWNSIKCD